MMWPKYSRLPGFLVCGVFITICIIVVDRKYKIGFSNDVQEKFESTLGYARGTLADCGGHCDDDKTPDPDKSSEFPPPPFFSTVSW